MAVVERVRGNRFVYDIQIEKTECFFANDILVHNCAWLDDVSGGQDDAMKSKITREAVWDWYQGDLLPRLKPDAAIVCIGTHFHGEDLIGRLMHEKENGIEDWRIIRLPMIADEEDELGRKPGDRLWPEYFTEDMVNIARRNNELWMGAYQQKPIVSTGSYFKREWIHEYEKAPENLRIYGASDYAVTVGGGDFTVHLVAGVAENGMIYLLDCWRGKEATDTWVMEWLRLVKKWKPIEWFEEKGQITRGVGPFLSKAAAEDKVYCYRSQYAMPRGADGFNSKQVGAQSIRGRMAQGMVFFPKGAWWVPDAVAEMMAFPTERSGVHDDLIDGLSLLGRGLDTMVNATKPRDKKPAQWQTAVTTTFNDLMKAARKKRLESQW